MICKLELSSSPSTFLLSVEVFFFQLRLGAATSRHTKMVHNWMWMLLDLQLKREGKNSI